MPANYALLCKRLIYEHGYRVVAPSLPSVGAMPGVLSIAPDVESVRMAVEFEMAMGNDVVVIAHSYGGFVTTNALYGLMKNAAAGESKVEGQPGVVQLIHVASMVPFIGMNTGDVMKQADTGVERDEVGNPPGMNIDVRIPKRGICYMLDQARVLTGSPGRERRLTCKAPRRRGRRGSDRGSNSIPLPRCPPRQCPGHNRRDALSEPSSSPPQD